MPQVKRPEVQSSEEERCAERDPNLRRVGPDRDGEANCRVGH